MNSETRDPDHAEADEQRRSSGTHIRRGITWDADFYRGAKRPRTATRRTEAEPSEVSNDENRRDKRDD